MVTKECDYLQVDDFINPLDRRNGRVPSWVEVISEFKLGDLPPGEKKLYHAFYRAQRMFALGKPKKGGRLIKALDKLPYFIKFEDKHSHILDEIAKKVRKKGV